MENTAAISHVVAQMQLNSYTNLLPMLAASQELRRRVWTVCTSRGAGAEHHTPPGLFCACGASITPGMGWTASFWRGLGSPGSVLGIWDLSTHQRVNEFGGFSPPPSFAVCST